MISEDTRLIELATVVSEALEKAGIVATLSGGAAVSIYSANRYLSEDLDFVTNAVVGELERVLLPLGFAKKRKTSSLGVRTSPYQVVSRVPAGTARVRQYLCGPVAVHGHPDSRRTPENHHAYAFRNGPTHRGSSLVGTTVVGASRARGRRTVREHRLVCTATLAEHGGNRNGAAGETVPGANRHRPKVMRWR